MKKFVIECPSCGTCNEASTGFFAKKKIPCTCGYVINVKTDKVSSKKCSSCGRMVVYDQSKGEEAVCPVCKTQINTRESLSSMIEFSCPSCSCHLSAEKGAVTYTCPLCDTTINVEERVLKEELKNKGLASVIKYEGGNDAFVWKHPIENFNLGSQLIVHESQEAIFFRDGQALDLFGAGRYTLATQNLPLLEDLYKLPTNMDTVFHSEVYFINMTTQMGIKWGTDSKIRLFDPASGIHIEIGASGNFNLRVSDSRRLLVKVVGTTGELHQEDIAGGEGVDSQYMRGKFRALIMTKVKSHLAKAIKDLNINILEIDAYMDELSEQMRVLINDTLVDYGLTIPEFYITNILTPDDDPNYIKLKQQFADKTLLVRQEEVLRAEAEAARSRKMVEAETEAQLKMLSARGEAEALKIQKQAEAESYRMQAYAEADEMRAKGYTYQQETARQVGLEAMQNGLTGGSAGAGGADGSGGGGFFGDLASLGVTLGAVGGVVNMTKDALNPILGTASEIGASVGNIIDGKIPDGQMPLGQNPAGQNPSVQNLSGQVSLEQIPTGQNPESSIQNANTWDCQCGETGLTSAFCPACGTKRPEVQPEQKAVTWNCPNCGKTELSSAFCPECGQKKPDIPSGN